MCNRLTIKATKFQQSSANHFRAVAKNCLGANLPPPPSHKLGLNTNVKPLINELSTNSVCTCVTERGMFYEVTMRMRSGHMVYHPLFIIAPVGK